MFTLSLAVLAGAILLAIFREGERRAYWIGFAVLGWTYAVVAFSPILKSESPELLTSQFLRFVFNHLPQQVRMPPASVQNLTGVRFGELHTMHTQVEGVTLQYGVKVVRPFPEEQFHRIGHSIIALMFGVLGGVVGPWLHSTRREKELRNLGSDEPQRR
ncbi:MAG: hypothetical protein HY000_10225 [Planctomycetes bacterium]|nr:hypothetical protein [Planctomycetota bacterium]